MSDLIKNESEVKEVKKKVVRRKRKVVKKLKMLKIKGGSNRGIGNFAKEYIMERYNKGMELDVKKLDEVLFKKYGVGKGGDKSRIKSIRWYINDLRSKKLIG